MLSLNTFISKLLITAIFQRINIKLFQTIFAVIPVKRTVDLFSIIDIGPDLDEPVPRWKLNKVNCAQLALHPFIAVLPFMTLCILDIFFYSVFGAI